MGRGSKTRVDALQVRKWGKTQGLDLDGRCEQGERTGDV